MGSRYLTDLAQVCRSIGTPVHEESGWQSRARSSGGYNSGKPDHVMVHHTASNASSDGQSDVNYMCYHSNNKPIANLYLSRKGEIWVMAAGGTNTNGAGTCPHCGAESNMNSRAIGIEAGNNGVGEPWPNIQQDVYVLLVAQLCIHYEISNSAIVAHFEYAPARKIDPAGQSKYALGRHKWNMNAFRADCKMVSPGPGPGPTPTPTTEDDLVPVCIQSGDGNAEQKFATFAWVPGVSIGWITSQLQIDVGRITGTLKFESDGDTLKNFKVAEIQSLIDRYWSGGPVPPGYTQPAKDT